MSKTVLGIELGSTRIKATAINEHYVPISSARLATDAVLKYLR